MEKKTLEIERQKKSIFIFTLTSENKLRAEGGIEPLRH